ncbi:hypothetical protein GUJ93_ZPchr0012g21458 [Zizania palustris]|uniref:Uncharacterized protein n=1 Tax=Zizania palustris TaxID=103762 RepID=A0A8J5WMR6_ZIZPA|nr:hypothetical protein GUJ93_ZPchr0012g21458 [Zizania palustris]
MASRGAADGAGGSGSGGGDGEPELAGAKKPWSKEEDMLLRALVQERGAGNWEVLSLQIPGRIGKSCCLRWTQNLDPASTARSPSPPRRTR